MPLPFPSFYDSASVGSLFVERGDRVAQEALAYRREHQILPASDDSIRVAAFGIDCQVGFCHPEASLFVPGAVEDTKRTIEWLYRNLNSISSLYFSLDTHSVFQIFHPAWWSDEEGNHPPPMTTITTADVESGKWIPRHHPKESMEYCQKLEKAGKYVLTIWPYHTLLGGTSHALVPALMEASIFHNVARLSSTHFETKGEHSQTENYSVFSPEVQTLGTKSVGQFNTPFFDALMQHDRIYVFGQASSHCVMSSLQDMLEQVKAVHPSWVEKIWILEDAMSPVPAPPLKPLPDSLNFPAIAERALQDFVAAGMNVAKTTDPIVLEAGSIECFEGRG